MANSYFNLVSESGLKEVSLVFDVPYCSVNVATFNSAQTWKDKSIITFKKFWSIKKKSYLTFNEIKKKMDSRNKDNVGKKITGENTVHFFIDNEDIKIIDNEPDEILDAVKEIEERLKNNKWEDEYSNLQKKIWKNFPINLNKLHGPVIRTRVSEKFLEKNRDLLK